MMARLLGHSISKTTCLVGCSRNAVVSSPPTKTGEPAPGSWESVWSDKKVSEPTVFLFVWREGDQHNIRQADFNDQWLISVEKLSVSTV